jgi:hypothetical protein
MDLLKPKRENSSPHASAVTSRTASRVSGINRRSVVTQRGKRGLMEHYTRVAIAALRFRVPSLA